VPRHATNHSPTVVCNFEQTLKQLKFKNKMKTILSIMLYCVVLLTYGQTKIIESEFIKSKDKVNYPIKSIITERGEIIVLNAGKAGNGFSFKKDYSLIHFDKDLKFIKQKELKKEVDGEIIGFEVVNNIINLIIADKNYYAVKKVLRYYCSVENFDFKKQTLYERKKGKGATDFSISENKEHYSLVVGERKIRKNMLEFEKANEILLFNKDFELENRYDVENLQNKDIYNVLDIYTLNNSTTLLLVKEEKGKNNFAHKFIVCKDDSKEVLNIILDNKFIKDLNIFISNNQVYLAGHYSNKKKSIKLNGFYFSKLNLDSLKFDFNNFIPFSANYINEINLTPFDAQGEQINYLEILDFFETDDSFFFINEAQNNFYIPSSQTNSNFAVNKLYFDNLSINKFNKNGELQEYKILYKHIPMKSYYPQNTSVAISKNNEQIHVFLNSSVDEKDGQVFYKSEGNESKNYEFIYNNELEYTVIEHNTTPIKPINPTISNKNSILLYSNNNDGLKLIKIKTKE
jgi:hypothetical protein